MLSDLEIAKNCNLESIETIAEKLGIESSDLIPYGKDKAKVSLDVLTKNNATKPADLVLVTSINPTPAGEGKSTVTVGLAQALQQLGKSVSCALREPSLGPVMGIKGGATGGGYSQVVPMESINLHFTGDIHAITAANNALSALIDNHIFQGNALNIDIRRITWKRVVDLNDRALREVIIGLGGVKQGIPREDGFTITVASEIMAVLCLADSYDDLKLRLGRMIIGYTVDDEPVTVKDLAVEGALTLLLKEAFQPNLVQTLEGVPAFIHGGPFANIAHGCNSVIATKMASKVSDIVVTEAGFGADLGAEKFLNIKSRMAELNPKAVVVVATIRALKMHGGVPVADLDKENVEALLDGLSNLKKHTETIEAFELPYVVAINQFTSDTKKEVEALTSWCQTEGIAVAETNVWKDGGRGGLALGKEVLKLLEEKQTRFKPLYPLDASLKEKIEKVATTVYGAAGVDYNKDAEEMIHRLTQLGFDNLPICMAKTQYSLSDDPTLLGRPKDFRLMIREIRPSIGAGFIVCLTGEVLTMPGLPKQPAALQMDIGADLEAIGLF